MGSDTFVEAIRTHAEDDGERIACTCLIDGITPHSLTYAELDQRARSIAVALGPEARGERVLLLYPPSLDFLACFLGCLYAGAVAVPLYPPRSPRMLPRLRAIVSDAGATRYATTGKIAAKLAAMSAEVRGLEAMAGLLTDDLENRSGSWRMPDIDDASLSFLQYTSGSTATPKGVRVTHGNLVHSQRMIAAAMQHDRDLVGVSWLPPYHDMGLIGNLLQPLFLGARTVILSPADFVRRPYLWLRAISDYHGTASGGPNFGYDLCVQRIPAEDRSTLDLSTWRVAFNGAEPVRAETLVRFSAAFEPCGFRPGSFYPCYGLAEATLMVSGGAPGTPPGTPSFDRVQLEQHRAVESDGEGQRLVSCGTALLGEELYVVDPETGRALGECEVGEIWVAGPHIADGYWRRPEESERVFGGRLEGRAGRYLRTGDLGFLRRGELFVTGRIKDLLIVRGRNIHPQDIEHTMSRCHPALRATGAAFGLEVDGHEQIAVVNEVDPGRDVNLAEVIAAVRAAVTAEHELEPQTIVLVRPRSVPLTSSGKVRRRACRDALLAGELKVLAEERTPATAVAPEPAVRAFFPDAAAIRDWLSRRIAHQLGVAADSIDADASFDRFALDSIKSVTLIAELESWLQRPLPATLAWEHPTIRRMAARLAGEGEEGAHPLPRAEEEPIAVVGMACRFPQAPDVDAYWSLLRDGGEGVRPPSAARKRVPAPEPHAGYLDEIDGFDAGFFGISPREVTSIDPQQRLLLEVAWEALEDTGLRTDRLSGQRVGMFLGISHSDYSRLLWRDSRRANAWALTGNAASITASRLSYLLDLRGPALAVDTACSSSLVAVHLACRSLIAGDSETALAGGVNLLLSPEPGQALRAAGALSPSGNCRPFDAQADGYVRSEGCGVVVLMRLSTARRQGARVLALIRGSAVNQDGRTNGLTAPSGRAQAEVLGSALAAARVSPSEVNYVEAHGTGTPLGDPIELRALGSVVGTGRADSPCAVGSVKGNLGHLEAAAGIAGLIKTVLSLEHGELVPHIGLREVNPHSSLGVLGLTIPVERQPWPAGQRVAGVSSFGFSGVNAHVVLEAAPEEPEEPADPQRPHHLIRLSSHSEAALGADAERLASRLEATPDAADVCFTANTGRAELPYRAVVAGHDGPTLAARLRAATGGHEGETRAKVELCESLPVCFLFSGQGAQHPAMGALLYRTQPVYRDAIDRCDAAVQRSHGIRLRDALLDSAAPIAETWLTQPALVAVELALAELWRSWGVTPAAVLGHSIGELAATCVTGALSLDEVMALAAERGRLMAALPRDGAMAAVEISEERLSPTLAQHCEVAVACYNGPNSLVLSGRREPMEVLLAELRTEGVMARSLEVSHAFHSPLMEAILPPLAAWAASLKPRLPRIPLFSTVTGQVLTAEPDGAYWQRHARSPVRFAEGARGLMAAGHRVLVELGPRPVLTGLVRRLGGLPPDLVLAASLDGGTDDDWTTMMAAIARLHLAGVSLDWRGFDAPYQRRRVRLPPRSYQRRSLWFDEPPAGTDGPAPTVSRLGGILDRCLEPPRGSARYERRFTADDPIVAEHCIDGVPTLPAAAHLELAMAAVRHNAGRAVTELIDITLARPLQVVGETDVEVSVRTEDGEVRWSISSAGDVCSWGGASIAKEVAPARCDLTAVVARCSHRLDGGQIYARMCALGLAHGPAYQSLSWLRAGNDEVLARLERPSGGAMPALLDGALQSLAGLLLDSDGAKLPFRVGRLRCLAELPPIVYAHARPVVRGAGADIDLIDEQGVLVAVLEQVELRPVRKTEERFWDAVGFSPPVRPAADAPTGEPMPPFAIADATAGEQSLPDEAGGRAATILALTWRPLKPEPLPVEPRAWLLLADRGGMVDRLQAYLQMQGEWCATVTPEALRLEEARRVGAVVVVDLRALDGGSTEYWIAEAGARIAALVTVLAQTTQPPKWWLVTRGAAATTPQASPDPAAAALCGLARTVALEQPVVFGGMIDLDQRPTPSEHALLAEALRQPVEEEQALRDGRRLVPRLERTQLPAVSRLACRPDATYLITGGLGDLALEAAAWLADHGARRLLLLGRTELPPRAEWPSLPPGAQARRASAVADLERRDVTVELAVADVGDEAALRIVLAAERPPIAGVLHLAAIAGEATLASLDSALLQRTLRPKATAAAWLDRHIGEVDFWVLFSSVASLLGAPGQAAYSAANAYLDALAQARRARGRAALAVSFGPWSVGGMATRAEGRSPQVRLGRLAPQAALGALECLLASNRSHAGVIGFDVAELTALLPEGRERSLLSELVAPALGGDAMLPALLALPPEQRRQSLADAVAGQIALVLQVDAAAIPRDQALSRLGLDSLMAIELRNRLAGDLQMLPSLSTLISASVDAITDDLLPRLAEPAAPLVPRADLEVRLSCGQRALWFLAQLAPGSTAYNVGEAVRVRGLLDVEALRRAFARLARRHDVLRTVFIDSDGEPRQRVLAALEPDFAALAAPGEDDAMLYKRLVADIDRPYDLRRGPLLRVRVYSRAADDHVVLLAVHHIVEDFWSLVLILQEVGTLYRAERDDGPAPAPPARQYADFVRWQESMLAGAEGERLWSYWAARLEGELPVLSLPTARSRPPVKTYGGETHFYCLGSVLPEQVREFAEREGVTRYTVLLAAFFALLHRYSGSEDLIVGSPAAGRSRPEFSDVIGYFDNPLPLRAHVDGQRCFSELLAQTREVVLGALENQDLPFPTIVERLNPPRDPSRSPLFDVMFVLRKSQAADAQGLTMATLGDEQVRLDLAGLPLEPLSLALRRDVSQFDFTLALAEMNGELNASIEYNRELFSAGAIDAFAAHYSILLGAAVAEPERPVQELPLATDLEQQRAWVSWNDTRVARQGKQLLHELFEERAACQPDAPAVIASGVTLSYADLNRRADALAGELGAGRDELVAVAMEKGWEQVVATLAVLKSGAAYVPLDPELPRERALQLLERCGVRQVLTQPAFAGLDWPAQVISVTPKSSSKGDLRRPASPSDLAYVLFTSGSTGEPKGVMIEHRAAANTLLDVIQRFEVGPGDRILAFSSLSFDLSVFDVFGALAAGAAVVIPDASRFDDPAHWREILAREHVTIWNSVPMLFQLLVQHCDGAALPPSLRLALLSGDWIPLALPDQARHLAPDLQLVSLGGATESAIWSVLFPIGRIDPAWRSIPYGRPMENQRLVVLDDRLEVCPVGVAGDLYIGGDGLARGYWRDPQRTQASFINHPSGERLYRTGDLARYFGDGTIEFLGRADQQIKLAGHRIEPGEVEEALKSHPRVSEAAVVVRLTPSGEQRLVAFYVADGEVEPPELRVHLQATLPRNMVPRVFVAMPAMPLGPNGKFDRLALEVPEAAVRRTPLAPRTPTERGLLEAWREVLAIDGVGVEDDFFELGGDSVTAIRVAIAAARRGLEITPREVIEQPTVRSLARIIEARYDDVTQLQLAPLQRRLLTECRRSAVWLVRLELLRPIERTRLAEALDMLVARHDALRLKLETDGLQSIRGGGVVLDDAATEEAAFAELRSGLDATGGALLGAALFPGGLVLGIHAFAADRDSLSLLIGNLERLLDGDRAAEIGSFVGWLERQPGIDGVSVEPASASRHLTVVLPEEETSALFSLGRVRHRAEPAETVLAAVASALAAQRARGELVIEAEVRRDPQLHAHIVGPLAVPRTLQLASAPAPVLLPAVKEQLRRDPVCPGRPPVARFAFAAAPQGRSWFRTVEVVGPPTEVMSIEAWMGGRLELNFRGDKGLEALGAATVAELRRLGRGEGAESSAAYSSADFPLANLSQQELDALAQRLGED